MLLEGGEEEHSVKGKDVVKMSLRVSFRDKVLKRASPFSSNASTR